MAFVEVCRCTGALVWFGVLMCGVVRFAVVCWCGAVWCGEVRCGVWVWCGDVLGALVWRSLV